MSLINDIPAILLRQQESNKTVNRHVFLKIAAATGITAATASLGDTLFTAAPWLDYDKLAQRTWGTPFHREVAVPAQTRELVRYATLAPSGHNAQPWRFTNLGEKIRISPDYSRRLPIVDPLDRELWISLGCALENFVIAARYAGYETAITYPEPDADYLTLQRGPSLVPHSDPLFDAIPHRQSTRSLYDGRSVPHTDLKELEAVSADTSVFPLIFTATEQKEKILEYIETGNERQYDNPPFISELISWLRFNKPEALQSRDGLYTRCGGNPELPRWLGKRFVTRENGKQQSISDTKNVRSSSGLIVIAAAKDDKRHWIETGRLCERLALTLTACNLRMAFLNQPIEVAALRSQFQSYLNLGAAQPQLLLRFGYADAMPRSLRRPLDAVMG